MKRRIVLALAWGRPLYRSTAQVSTERVPHGGTHSTQDIGDIQIGPTGAILFTLSRTTLEQPDRIGADAGGPA